MLKTYGADSPQRSYAATRVVVHNLAAAMLIKDGPYLGELASSPEKYARDRDKYNVNPAVGDRIVYRHLLHPEFRLLGRTVAPRLVVRHRTMKLLRSMRWLRRLPGWHAVERHYLAAYLAAIDAFAAAAPAEYDRHLAALSSPRCMNCVNPRCQEQGCPLGNAIPQWVQLAYQQRWREASEALHATNNFPEITGRVCPAGCQLACKQAINSLAVQIKDFEYQIVDRAIAHGWLTPRRAERKTGKTVAVIGSGPAGLAAAQQLARAGHDVTVFEKDARPGGLLRYGIPQFRLDKQLIDRRLEQLSAEGVTFRAGVEVGKDLDAASLRRDFDVILLATGAAQPRDLRIPGRQQAGVQLALEFLREAAQTDKPLLDGKTVAVIGGGLTGEDCVEMALRCGAARVHQLEILPQPTVASEPVTAGCHASAIDAKCHASAAVGRSMSSQDEATRPPAPDGQKVIRRWSVATKAFAGNGSVNELHGVQVRWSNTPAGKAASEIRGSEFRLAVDRVLLATGFDAAVDARLAAQLELPLTEAGRITAGDDGLTVATKVFLAGDLASGASYVAAAIASGRKAAEKINAFLKK